MLLGKKILMQGNTILTNVEAQRVMAVVDELCADMGFTFRLSPSLLQSQPDLQHLLPEHLRGYIQNQTVLEAQLKQIVSQLREPVSEFVAEKDQPERGQQEEALAQQFIQVSRMMRRNTRDLCRIMRHDPKISSKLDSILGRDPFAGTITAERFYGVLEQLQVQTLRGLATSVEEDKAEKEHFEVVAQREKKLAQEAKSLSKDLMAIKHERHKTITVKDDQIAQYKNELNELKALTAKAAASGGKKSEQNEVTVKMFNETKAQLLKEVKKRELELAKLKQENKEKEDGVAKRSFKKETDVESWITRYDQEMSDLTVEMLATRSAYEEEKCRLRFIEDYFERFRLAEGGTRFVTCSEVATAAEASAKKNRLDVNATRIQSAIRGHLTRKDLENKSKKKGKKGKGKGKKK